MIWFQLWREYKLSIAELLAIFPKWDIVYFNKDILILSNISFEEAKEKASRLWWTIKVFKVDKIDNLQEINNILISKWEEIEWKFKYWISVFWEKINLKSYLLDLKKSLKKNDISSRFVNKDFSNLSSSQIIWENLINRWTDFSIILWKNNYFWESIWIQDIESYSDRDYSKTRDMQVWMLPPKLSQMMINIAWWNVDFDPFVWLGTILIESIYMWNKEVYWSDLSDKMVET